MSETEYGKIIAKNLRRILFEAGKTQADLSKDLKINKATISTWMNGTRIPRMDKIDLLCHYFNVSRSDIMEDHSFSAQFDAGIKAMTPMDEVRTVYARNRKELSKEERMRLAAEILQDDDEDL